MCLSGSCAPAAAGMQTGARLGRFGEALCSEEEMASGENRSWGVRESEATWRDIAAAARPGAETAVTGLSL